MARDMEFLLKAEPNVVAESVKTYGVITFFGNGLTENQNYEIATRTIGSLSKELTSLRTILSSDKRVDDSYKSVTFEVARKVGTMAIIQRRVKYIEIPGMEPVDDIVEEGPIVPADKAQALCDVLNG